MLRSSCLVSAVFLVCSVCHCMSKPDEDRPRGFPDPGIITGPVSKEKIDACLVEVGMTKDEFHARMENRSAEPSEKQLCVGKCIGLSVGAISKDGKLDIDFIKEHLPPKIKDDGTITSCLQKIGSISTCQDMKNVRECFPKRENN